MPDQRLSFGSYEVGKITIEPTSIRAEGGPEYPRLIVPLNVNLGPIVERFATNKTVYYEILTVQCALSISNPPARMADALPYTNHLRVHRQNTSSTLNIEFQLDHYRIVKIEEKRKRDLQIQLDFRFVVTDIENFPVGEGGKTNDFVTGLNDSWARFNIEIPHSHWIDKILPNLGYGKVKLIEIPIPEKIIPKAFNKALEELGEAHKYFVNANYDAAVANCRKVIELIITSRRLKLPENNNPSFNDRIEAFLSQHLPTRVANSKRQYLKDVIGATWKLSSLPQHPSQSDYFTRQDAEAVILHTTTVLAYIGKLLQESENKP